LILITSNQEYDSSVPGESDQSAAPFFHWRIKEESSQFSQEIRLTSNATDKSQYMIGAYYQDTDTMNYTNLARWVIPLAITRPLNIDNKTVSFFATMTFFVSEQLHVTAGLRRTKVDKDYMRPPVTGTNGPHAFDDFNLDFAHEADALASLVPDSYNENATLPSLMIQYFKDENSMFYASYSDGFKSGGYEALGVYKANRGSYGSEAVDAYEFGYKTSNDKMKMSVNYFHSEYDGNQLSQYVYPDTGGVPYTTTSNIPSTNKGFELELSYLLTDSVIADLSFTNLDATYDSYEGGTCAAGISPPEGAAGCDYSGRTLLHAPENTGLFTLSSENEMSNGMTRNSSISVYWTDDQWHNTDYNVNSQEEGFSKVDARVEFSKDDWYVAILGKNLTDEYTSSWNQQTAYTLGTGQFAILERTRSVAIQFGKNF
jgi:outer membrane receptor protein involved in Fe transport